MLYLQVTKKALTRLGLGREELADPGETGSALGNWLVNLVPLGGREAYLFMSTRSLISFPIMIGQMEPGPEDMGDFLAHGIQVLMKSMKIPRAQSTLLLKDLEEIALCGGVNRPLLGIQSAIANDYFQHIALQGDLPAANISAAISDVNSRPRAMLEWSDSFEVSARLLRASVA